MMSPEIASDLARPNLTSRHRKIIDFARRRLQASHAYWSQRHSRYRECEHILRAFRLPDQTDLDTRDNPMTEGVEKIVVPYGYAVLYALHAFCMETLTQRNPIIPVEAVGPAGVLPAMLMEQQLATQCERMPTPYYLILYQIFLDAFRYGVGITKCLWGVNEWPSVERDASPIIDPMTGQPMGYTEQVTQRDVITYEGNQLLAVSPFDFYPDHRRPLGDFQKGEYCAHHFVKSYTEMRQAEAQGLYVGVEHVPKQRTESEYGGSPFGFGAQVKSDLARIMDMSWLDRSAVDEQGRPYVDLYEMWAYIEDIDELELGPRVSGNEIPGRTPQMWVITIANLERVVRLEQAVQPALRFPFEIFEPNFDLHSPANHSLIEVFRGLQYYYSWLFNSRMTAVRRTLNNEMIYDPEMVDERDILDPEPGRLIRVKREHRGEGRAKDAVWPIPIQDSTQSHLQDASVVRSLIQEVLGVPAMLMGMPNTGRRPATETQSVMKSATGRLGTLLAVWAAQYGQPLAFQMARNTQLFLDCSQPMQLRDPYRSALGMPFIQMRPDLLKGEFLFPFLSSGLPTDKQAEAAIWKEFLMAGMQANPQMLASFPWPVIITRFLRAMNIKDFQSFGLNMGQMAVMAPEDIQQQLQKGNLVPAGGPGGGPPGPPQQPVGAQQRMGANGAGGGFPMPPYETVPGVGPNGMGRA